MKDQTLLILNGPGLADLSIGGERYGNITLEQIRDACSALCNELGMDIEFRQTDDIDKMFRWIAEDSENFSALIINPVGYLAAHTVDFDMYHAAIKMIAHRHKPIVEVHLTNIFRDGAELTKPLQGPEGEMGFVCGLGIHSYLLGIKAVAKRLQHSSL
jgi:3-dehydroquinate dehydratase-2